MSEKRKLPIDRPCSACSAGDTEMEYHDHHPPFREPVASPQATRPEVIKATQCTACSHPEHHQRECSVEQCYCIVDSRMRSTLTANDDLTMDEAVGIAQGLQDVAEGRMKPFEQIKKELRDEGLHKLADQLKASADAYLVRLNTSEGTTPQAERPLSAPHKKWKTIRHKSEARAVAPVETPDVELCQICHRENPVWFAPNAVWNAVVTEISGILCPICFIKRAEQQGFRCTGWELVPELVNRPTDDKTPVGVGAPANLAPAQTRLTAEQFLAQQGFADSIAHSSVAIAKLMEAFRDKSESLGWTKARELFKEVWGLREEIERLKEGERSVRDFLERDYGVSEITTICSRYDDAIDELDEAKELLREARPRAPQKKWHEQVKALLSRGKKPTKRQAELTELRAKRAEQGRAK